MDNWLKALIAAACICVIAVSVHYGYSRYEGHRAAMERMEAMQAQRSREEEAEKQEQAERRKARYEAWKVRRDERLAEKERIKMEKQADRENAARILKDAVVE